jgi:hypothetical protein
VFRRLSVIAALITSACGAPKPAPRTSMFVNDMTCPQASDARASLERVLVAHGAEYARFRIVVDTPWDDKGKYLRLLVIHESGEMGLQRLYELKPEDCASGAELLALGLDRFLTSFPEWIGPPRPSTPVAPPDRWLEVAGTAAVNSMFVPVGVDAQLGGMLDIGGERDRLGGTLLVRGSIPQAAGSGRFQQTSFLAGASYRHRTGVWELRGEARAGALLVIGMGFDQNDHDWLPWWEGAAFAGRRFGWGAIGVEVAASGLRHKAVTRDGLVSEDIPLLRLGLAIELGSAKKP